MTMELQIVRTRYPPEPYLDQLATLLRIEVPDITLDDLKRRLELLPADVLRTKALAFFSSLSYVQSNTSQEYVRDLDVAHRAEAPTQPQ